jgi:archaemetzincin
MPKRKIEIPYVHGFRLPSADDVQSAIGTFPWTDSVAKINKHQDALLGVNGCEGVDEDDEKERDGVGRFSDTVTVRSIKQCDDESLYADNKRGTSSASWKPLPPPIDEGAWLANVNEEGQTFSQYVSMVTLRSGQLKPNTCYTQSKIYIVPIVDHDETPVWPRAGPTLDGLAAWMSAFFSKPVQILDFVTLIPIIQEDGTRKRAAKNKVLWKSSERESRLVGRVCKKTGRYQTHVNGLLDELFTMKEDGKQGGVILDDAFSVVGVTMCDLYSCNADLFVAGMAAGGSKVAVLSFARYHPMLKMSPEKWEDYGYIKKMSNYSYFEDNKRRPATSPDAPHQEDMDPSTIAELFRRAGKLLIHEMCHVYGIDHCVHHHCLMNGTAHLVEDFASPCQICRVCLRKLQFRLGFDVRRRYNSLAEVYRRFGMREQVKWVEKRLSTINENVVEPEIDNDTNLVIDLTED